MSHRQGHFEQLPKSVRIKNFCRGYRKLPKTERPRAQLASGQSPVRGQGVGESGIATASVSDTQRFKHAERLVIAPILRISTTQLLLANVAPLCYSFAPFSMVTASGGVSSSSCTPVSLETGGTSQACHWLWAGHDCCGEAGYDGLVSATTKMLGFQSILPD